MSQSSNPNTPDRSQVAELGVGVELPQPLPTEVTVRRGFSNTIFLTLRNEGRPVDVYPLRETDAFELSDEVSEALNSAEYREEKESIESQNPGFEAVESKESETASEDQLPFSGQQTHRILSTLPPTPDIEPVRNWLLGTGSREGIGYKDWIHLLQSAAGDIAIQWATEARSNAGYAMWDTDPDVEGSLRVRLSTGTETQGDRATSVVVDVVADTETKISPVTVENTPFGK